MDELSDLDRVERAQPKLLGGRFLARVGHNGFENYLYKCSFTQCTWVYYIGQMNFQVNIYFPHTFQMYFWTISFLSWPFQMMNLNRPSEFSALNFCFDLTGCLCSILNWNLLKILSRTQTFRRHERKFLQKLQFLAEQFAKTSGSRWGIRNFQIFPKKWQN